MSMTQAPFPAHQPFYAAAPTPTMPFYTTPNRKRRAATPPSGNIITEDISGPASSPAGSTTFQTPPASASSAEHRDKRRRANLANVLSSMSLDQRSRRSPSPLPSYQESQAIQDEVDEDDLFRQTVVEPDELQVEILPESSSSTRADRQSFYASQSESSESESDISISEDIYRRPRRRYRRHAINTQQADAIEQPGTPWEPADPIELGVEDMSSSTRRRKRRHELDGAPSMKRRRSDMDLEMDDNGNEVEVDDYEMRSRKAPTSYEPEKDRKSSFPLPHYYYM